MTVFSDASLKDNVAAVGWWYIRNGRSGTGSERLDLKHAKHSGVAELAGLVHAMEDAIPRSAAGPETFVVLQCDALFALGTLLGGGLGETARSSDTRIPLRRPKGEVELDLIRRMEVALGGRTLWLKHVKGHSKRLGSRHRMNELTDRLARKARVK